MSYIDFQPQLIRRPKKQKKLIPSIIFAGFVLSLFFIDAGDQYFQQAEASPTPQISDVEIADSYINVSQSAYRPLIHSKSYILIDAANGEVILEKGGRDRLAVASTTKMVTALLARELFELDEVVEVGRFPASIGGSSVGLVNGEKITVRELLKGLMVRSGNDTAYALAEHYSKEEGNYQDFVKEMNRFIARNNLTSSVFDDPAGLSDDGISSAWELAQITRLLLKDDFLREIVSIGESTIYSADGRYKHDIRNTNRLVVPDSGYYNSDIIGVKTGFTLDAGHCLVSAFHSPAGEIISVVLNTAEFNNLAPVLETRKLYNWSQSSLERVNY